MENEYDEDKAVTYMAENAATVQTYNEDQLLNIIDIIWDYYEERGELTLDIDSDVEEGDAAEIVAHVTKVLAKDKGSVILREDIAPLVLAELDYEKSVFDI